MLHTTPVRNAIRHYLGLDALRAQGEAIMATIQELKTQVDANTSAEQGAIALLNGLGDRLAAVAADPKAVQEMADELKASATALGAAIVANTPAAGPAPSATPPLPGSLEARHYGGPIAGQPTTDGPGRVVEPPAPMLPGNATPVRIQSEPASPAALKGAGEPVPPPTAGAFAGPVPTGQPVAGPPALEPAVTQGRPGHGPTPAVRGGHSDGGKRRTG